MRNHMKKKKESIEKIETEEVGIFDDFVIIDKKDEEKKKIIIKKNSNQNDNIKYGNMYNY